MSHINDNAPLANVPKGTNMKNVPFVVSPASTGPGINLDNLSKFENSSMEKKILKGEKIISNVFNTATKVDNQVNKNTKNNNNPSSKTNQQVSPLKPPPLYYVPNVGYKGSFGFKSPFDQLYNPNKKYTVTSIRDLKEMRDSDENPFENIFEANGLTQSEFEECVKYNIPIAVLTDAGDNYYYIPCNYISKIVSAHGFQYIEKVLVVSLGYIPTGTDLTQLKKKILEDVQDTTGVISTVEDLPSSGVVYVSEQENIAYKKAVEKNMTNNLSWRQQYKDLEQQYKNLQSLNQELQNYILGIYNGTISINHKPTNEKETT